MGELEEKLNSILSSPKDMEKIMGLAKELSGSLGIGAGKEEKEPERESPLSGMMGGLDPKMLGMMSRLMGEYSSEKNDKMALVNSLKPYLKEGRRGDLDRAVKIAKIAHIAKIAFSEFGGDFDL